MRTSLTERIRQYRILQGLSQQNMADELNLTLAGYSKIERGETELTVNRLARIAGILGLNLNDILHDSRDLLEEPKAEYGVELSIAVVKLHNDVSALKEEINQLRREVNDLKGMKTAN